MRNKMELEIDGMIFTFRDGIQNSVLKSDILRGLYNCYKKPSDKKKDIFEIISFWFYNNGGKCGIHSYNSNIITISGYVNLNGIQIGILITPTYNYFFQLENEF